MCVLDVNSTTNSMMMIKKTNKSSHLLDMRDLSLQSHC